MGFWCVLPVPAQTRSLLPLLILFYKSTFHSSTANFPTVCGLSPVKLLPHYPSTQIWRNQRNQTCLTSRTLLSTSSGCTSTCTVKSREIRLAWQWILTPPICRSITILVVFFCMAVPHCQASRIYRDFTVLIYCCLHLGCSVVGTTLQIDVPGTALCSAQAMYVQIK